MRRVALILLAVVSCSSLFANDWSGPSWPTWRGPHGNGIVDLSASPAAVTKGKVLWTTSVGEGYSATCVVGNHAFTAGRAGKNDTVVCLDASTRKQVWSTGVESLSGEMPGTRFMPVFNDGKLYCMTRDGKAFCLNATDGALLWKTDISKEAEAAMPRWGFASSAILWKDLVLYNVGEWGSAVRKDNGKLVWKSPHLASGYSPLVPFTYKEKSYAAVFGSQALYIVDLENGAKVASTEWFTSYNVNVADPLVIGNRILVTSDYGKGAALFEFDGSSLKEIWENQVLKSHFSSVVYLDGFVYGNDGDANAMRGDFVCVDFATGKEMWRQTSDVGSLIAVKNGLLTLNEMGRLALAGANPKKYTELASNKKISRGLFWCAPTLAGGRLYLRTNSGDVVCVEMPESPIAERFFDLQPSAFHLFVQDGRYFLNTTRDRYDAVILDAFVGDSSPTHLMSREAFSAVKRVLTPDGVLVMNTFADYFMPDDFVSTSLTRTLASVFPSVRVHGVRGGNTLFVASPRPNLSILHPPVFDGVHAEALAEVREAFSRTLEPPSGRGLVLSDDYNPVEFYDAANRERLRRSIALSMHGGL